MNKQHDDSQINRESSIPLYLAISIMFNIAMFVMFMLPELLK